MKIWQNICRTQQKNVPGKRRPWSHWAAPQVVMVVKHVKKGLLMFYFFFKVAGSGWMRSTFMTTPFWFGESQPGLTHQIHSWPISATWDGLLWIPELKPQERTCSMQVGPPCSLPPLRMLHDKTHQAVHSSLSTTQHSTARAVLSSSLHGGGSEQGGSTCMSSQGTAPGCHLGAFKRRSWLP